MKNSINSDDMIILGIGGHARFVIATALEAGMQIKGLLSLDDKYNEEEKILDYPILGLVSDLPLFFEQGFKDIFLATGNNLLRKELFKNYFSHGFNFPTIIHPDSSVDSSAFIGIGNIIGPKVVIGADVKIGNNNIINSSCVIEHESVIKNNTHVAPGSVICGRVKIGNQVMIGANSTVIENIKIAKNNIIGAGSTVVKTIKSENDIFVGSPAKLINS